jgi:hypothetical protein
MDHAHDAGVDAHFDVIEECVGGAGNNVVGKAITVRSRKVRTSVLRLKK